MPRPVSEDIIQVVADNIGLNGTQLVAKVEQGLVFFGDLDLSRAEALVRKHGEEPEGDGSLVKTGTLQRIIDALCQLSMEDPATGLYNRRYFEVRLAQELHRVRRESDPCSLVMVDLDRLKQINDRFGHEVGDLSLCHVASLMQQTLRVTDIVTRIGGDEFAVILPNTDQAQALCAMTRVMQQLVRSPLKLDQVTVELSISVGIGTCSPSSSFTPQELLRRADGALYRAKGQGRNRVEVDDGQSEPWAGVSVAERDELLK